MFWNLTEEQQNLYEQLKKAIKDDRDGNSIDNLLEGVSGDDLLKVLASANIIAEFPHGLKCILTPLGLAVGYNDAYGRIEPMSPLHLFSLSRCAQKKVEAILNAAEKQGILEKVLTTANIIAGFSNGEKYTLTPLGLAIHFNNQQKNIETILNAAKKQGILEKVLTNANGIAEFSNGKKGTLTSLGLAVLINNQQKNIETILNAAKKQGILEKVLTNANGIAEFPGSEKRTETPLGLAIRFNKKKIETILNAAKEQGILEKILAALDEDEYQYIQAKFFLAKVIISSTITGGICGVIAALIVGGGCFAANFGLSTLVIVGIAVAAALVVGVVSGGITYAVLKFNHNKHLDNERSVNRNQSQESAKEMENFIEEPRHMDKATNTENVEELKPKEKPVPVVDNLIDLSCDYDKMEDEVQPSAPPLSKFQSKTGELYPWLDLLDLSKSDQQISF